MKKFLLALGLLSILSPAWAQNTTCSDRPAGDSSNACANTRFVQGAVVGSITLPSGQILVGNGSNIATPRTLTGSCTLTNLGVITCSAVPLSTSIIESSTGAFNFTVPANVFTVRIDANGAGGGGGGASSGTPGGAASGGGGGGYCGITLAVNPSDTITGVVGTGGTAGTSGADGGAGGNTTITYNAVTHTAGGGAGGHSATAGIAQNSVAGGTITTCDALSNIGQVSVQGIFSYNGATSIANGGAGGLSSNGGFGGNGGAGNGNSGSNAGGGGAGGGGTSGSVATGGAGGSGRVVIQY